MGDLIESKPLRTLRATGHVASAGKASVNASTRHDATRRTSSSEAQNVMPMAMLSKVSTVRRNSPRAAPAAAVGRATPAHELYTSSRPAQQGQPGRAVVSATFYTRLTRAPPPRSSRLASAFQPAHRVMLSSVATNTRWLVTGVSQRGVRGASPRRGSWAAGVACRVAASGSARRLARPSLPGAGPCRLARAHLRLLRRAELARALERRGRTYVPNRQPRTRKRPMRAPAARRRRHATSRQGRERPLCAPA
jgi:hypothetical protein